MDKSYLLAIDQGTTGTRAIVYDNQLNQVYYSYKGNTTYYPYKDWAEQKPCELYQSVLDVIDQVLDKMDQDGIDVSSAIKAMGISNQGESIIAWDKNTGKELSPVILWHCNRSSEVANKLKTIDGFEDYVKSNTGLTINSYFSATKMLWLLENNSEVSQANTNDTLSFGTLDAWLIYKLTQGESYYTDYSTASRTMLLNINRLSWDETILQTVGIKETSLPKLKDNCDNFGKAKINFRGQTIQIPIVASAVDQQCALFGQKCFEKGMTKITYGTGCFLLLNIGDKPILSSNGLMTSVGWKIGNKCTYIMDGAVYMAGALMNWLRDKMGLFEQNPQMDELALSLQDNGGVYFVSALAGLSAPYWANDVKGSIYGLSASCDKRHIVRAALESIAYQIAQIISLITEDSGICIKDLRVDGGLTKSPFLMQFQSDIMGLPLSTMKDHETTAKGIAMLAGLSIGMFEISSFANKDDVKQKITPQMSENERNRLLKQWNEAVVATLNKEKEI